MTIRDPEDRAQASSSAAARAEAAAWIARLHGPSRTRAVEEGLRRWMAEDPERAAAFELVSDVWDRATQLRRGRGEGHARWHRPGVRINIAGVVLGTVAAGLLALLVAIVYYRSDGYSTGIGEQRTLALPDGSRIYLNTDSLARVHYDRHRRRVDLVRGEALFEVAKRPEWPFIVSAGGQNVRAVGTAFDVRTERDQMMVTLLEGQVTVGATTNPLALGEAASRQALRAMHPERNAIYTLTPGERLVFRASRTPQVDYPSLETATAWRHGQVVLDNTPLSDAVAEMNRYSAAQLSIEDPKAGLIRISGIFTIGDSEDFAQAIARTYQLRLRMEAKGMVLVGPGIMPHGGGGAQK